MHTILTIQEAFAAKQAGKNIVCRHTESEYFESLDRVSAETWFDPHYVFALQIETIVVAGFEFTKPYTLDELTTGQEIFYIGASGTILKGTFNPDNEMLVSGVNNGSVQRDEENATKQIKAVRSLLNITSDEPTVIDYDFFVVDGESTKSETKKRRGGRKSKDTQPVVSDENLPLDKTDTAIKVFTDKIDVASMTYELEEIQANLNDSKDKLHPEEVEQIKALIVEKQNQIDKLAGDTAVELMTERLQSISTIGPLNDLEVDVKNQKLATPVVAENCDQLLIDIAAKREKLNQIDFIDQTETSAAQSPVDAEINESHADIPTVASIREASEQAKGEYMLSLTEASEASAINRLKESFDLDRRLIFTHKSHLDSYVEIRLKDIAKKESEALQIGKPDHHQVIADKIHNALNLVELEQIEGTLTESDKSHHFLNLANARDSLTAYENCLNNLINQVQQAITIDEANEPASKTLGWSDAQRLPLLTAISKRLVELDVTLLTQIRTAPSIAILNCLLSEVKAIGTGTYAHNCMEAYRERRYALTQTSPA